MNRLLFLYLGAGLTALWDVALILIGGLVVAVSLVDPVSAVSSAVYVVCSIGLLTLAAVSLFTGFRVKFIPFRLCPFVLTASALLIVMGGLL